MAEIISKSAVVFEYTANIEHARIVELLRKAVIFQDVGALVALSKIVKDVRGQ